MNHFIKKIVIMAVFFTNTAIAQTIYVQNGATLYIEQANTATATVSVEGSVENNGTVVNTGRIDYTQNFTNNSVMKGNGVFGVGTAFTNNSTSVLAPFFATFGKMTVIGDYTSGSSALNIMLGGTTAGVSYDQLSVSGVANVANGVLNVSFESGYTPIAGDAFVVLDANSLSGTFASVNLPDLTPFSPTLTWATDYDAAVGTVTLRINGTALPIKLLSFTGKAVEKYNHLAWTVANAVNFNHYELEKMNNDGSGSFSTLIVLNPLAKEAIDKNPYASTYYRLKMVDNDGSFAYSNVINIRREVKGFSVESVYPNPTSGTVSIVYSSASNAVVSFDLFDALGIHLDKTTVKANNGINTQTIDLSSLPAGVYFITIDNGSTKKIIKL